MARKKGKPTPIASKSNGKRQGAVQESGYFLSLSVRNVRCFGDELQTLDLADHEGRPAQWTLLLGENGTGKTTLLQCLAAAPTLGNVAYRSHEDYQERAFLQVRRWLQPPNHPLFRGSGDSSAEVRVRVLLVRDLQAADAPSRDFNLHFHQLSFQLSHGEFATLGQTEAVDRESPYPGYSTPMCFGYGAGRRLGAGALTAGWQQDACAGLFSDEVPLRNAEEWLSQLDWAASRSKGAMKSRRERELERVKELLVKVLPEVRGIRLVPPKKRKLRPVFEFETPYGYVPLDGIGYGYRTMVAWIVDFVSRMVERYPESPDPLSEPAVVLVDEIDLHLHPRWQRELMGYLSERFPNTQFIATAHSPLIAQAAPSVSANIAVLRREDDHVLIDNDVEAIRGWRVDQVLTSDLYHLPTARPAEFDLKIARRTELLSKSRLTKAEHRELAKLERDLGQLPAGETAADARRMMDLAQETLELLKRP